MTYLKEFIATISKATTTIASPLAKSKPDVIVYAPDGSIKEINLSSGLIMKLYNNGTKNDSCPKLIRSLYIDGKFAEEEYDSVTNTRYLQTKLLGCDFDGNQVNDLPRDQRTKGKKTSQQRLDHHVSIFGMIQDIHGIVIVKEDKGKNVQVEMKTLFEEVDGIKVNVYSVANIISPLKVDEETDYDLCILEVVATGDIYSNYSAFGIDKIANHDHIQLTLNSMLSEIKNTAYLVFDYSTKLNYKIFSVNNNPEHEDSKKANEAKFRVLQTQQTIKSIVADFIYYEQIGWRAEPSNSLCGRCNDIYCEYRGKTFEL
jgi:hypothetical protein